MTKTNISYEDFLKLNGLLALAAEHNKQIAYITRACAEITGAEDDGYGYFDHTSDAVNEGETATALLRKLEIAVDANPVEQEA